jgi:hypothetical protein
MQEIVISLVAAVARKSMYDRHADLYLGSKRDDFGWCETTPQYLRCNLNYEALGTKANSGRGTVVPGAPHPALGSHGTHDHRRHVSQLY